MTKMPIAVNAMGMAASFAGRLLTRLRSIPPWPCLCPLNAAGRQDRKPGNQKERRTKQRQRLKDVKELFAALEYRKCRLPPRLSECPHEDGCCCSDGPSASMPCQRMLQQTEFCPLMEEQPGQKDGCQQC